MFAFKDTIERLLPFDAFFNEPVGLMIPSRQIYLVKAACLIDAQRIEYLGTISCLSEVRVSGSFEAPPL